LKLGSKIQTSVSANAGGPRDATSRPIDHISLHTEFYAECDHQVTTEGRY